MSGVYPFADHCTHGTDSCIGPKGVAHGVGILDGGFVCYPCFATFYVVPVRYQPGETDDV